MTLLKLKALGAVALCATLAGGGFGLYAVNADEKKPAQREGEKPAARPDGEKPRAKPDGEKRPEKPAGEKRAPRQFKIAGQVAGVDAKENTVALAVKGDGGIVERFYPVAAGAKVFVDGKEAKLADVPKNAFVSGVATAGARDGEPTQIAELRATGRTVNGVVAKVDAKGVTLDGEKQPSTFQLAADGKVTVNGRDAKLADLKAGDKVTVTMKSDDSAALAITTGGRRGDGERPGRPEGERPVKNVTFGGKIDAVDAAARTVTLAAKGEAGRAVVVKLTAGAKVLVDGKAAKLSDVPPGAAATFTLASAKDGQAREASELVVSGPTFTGFVKQLDANSITIGSGNTDRVLQLVPGMAVAVGGKDAKVSDLKVGDRVQVTLSADETRAVTITTAVKRGEGDGDRPRPEK